MVRICLADDNIYALLALEEKLSGYKDITVVHKAADGLDLIHSLSINSNVDIILMDIEMPNISGIEATAKIKLKYPHVKIVIVTVFDDDRHILEALIQGADSYILKDTNAEKLYETIGDTLNGGAVMSPSIALKVMKLLKSGHPTNDMSSAPAIELSAREFEILEHLGKGLPNKLIAEKLFISPFTVKRHIENIYKKMQADNRITLLSKAKDLGLL